MSGSIPQAFIQDIIAKVDIVDIIQPRITLKKRGRNYQACCPFHDEKTPSFTVSPDKQFYYCFGCGAHGNVIGFLMAFDRMEFVEAIEHLAAHLGLDVPREKSSAIMENTEPLLNILQEACDYYQQQLRHHPEAILYLKNRGLSGEIAKKFRIGFAPSQWDNLVQTFKNPSQQKALIEAGMLIEKPGGRPFDRFRHRVMFPIRDLRGRVIAFGGRTITNEQPKYLNSPETPVFHKSFELYGLYELRQSKTACPHILVVEGYMDVISLHQHGIHYGVATLGTAINPKHIQKLLRFSSVLVFCFDGDKAGKQAAWKALTMSLPLLRDDLEFRFLFLPEQEDPDSWVQKIGPAAFDEHVKKSESITEVLFDILAKKYDIQTLAGKTHFVQEALALIEKMPHGIYHAVLSEKLAQIAEIDLKALTQNTPAPTFKSIHQNQGAQSKLLQMAMALLLKSPDLAYEIRDIAALQAIQIPGINQLTRLIQLLQEKPTMGIGELLTHWPEGSAQQAIAELAAAELYIPPAGYREEFQGSIDRLLAQAHSKTTQELIQKSRSQGLSTDERDRLATLLSEKKADEHFL